MHTVTVSQDGRGDFTTLTQAIQSLPPQGAAQILIGEGVYHEKITLDRPLTHLIGQSPQSTLITWGDGALHTHADGQRFQTFRTQTSYLGGEALHVKNLTIQNTAGSGEVAGQAIAAYVAAQTARFTNVHLLGRQDTLFLAPLPQSPRIPGSFIGPEENAPRTPCTHYFERCYIQGDVDFIFGGAMAAFAGCEIHSVRRDNPNDIGYIAAPCTPATQQWGLIFAHCRFTGDASQGSVYLARPWREHAACTLIGCELGEHIHPVGFSLWEGQAQKVPPRFAEQGSRGSGASPHRAHWVKKLSQAQADEALQQVASIARVCAD